MTEPTDEISLRDRLGAPLRERKLVIGIEILLALGCVALKIASVIHNPTLLILPLGWLSLCLRRQGWRGVGLSRPRNWLGIVGLGIAVGVAYDAIDILGVLPLLRRFTHQSADIGDLSTVRGSLASLFLYAALIWSLGALCEELTYRGYLYNRLTDLFGGGKTGTAVSVIAICLVFGLIHWNQGLTGVLDNVLAGGLFIALYLLSGRNLWLPIITHGVIDTASLVLLYLGYTPH